MLIGYGFGESKIFGYFDHLHLWPSWVFQYFDKLMVAYLRFKSYMFFASWFLCYESGSLFSVSFDDRLALTLLGLEIIHYIMLRIFKGLVGEIALLLIQVYELSEISIYLLSLFDLKSARLSGLLLPLKLTI